MGGTITIERLRATAEDMTRYVELAMELSRGYTTSKRLKSEKPRDLAGRQMRKQTWCAIIVCILILMPAYFVGVGVKIFYHVITLYFFGPDPDPFHAHSWFGIEVIQTIWKWMYRDVVPNLLQGLVAGILALQLTGFIYTGSRIVTVGLMTGLVCTTLLAVLSIVTLPHLGFTRDFFVSIYQLIGIWVGLIQQMLHMYTE
jgi:hypothetical protein